MKRVPLYILMGALLCGLPLVCNPYWLDVCVMIGLYALLALSLNVILGQAGIFHMGHAAFYAVGAYVTAILNTLCHWPIFWTMPLAGAAAALFALLVARPIIHLRGDYLLIVTIGIVEIVRIALINDVFGLTGGSNGIFGISRPRFFGYKIVKSVQFYYLVFWFKLPVLHTGHVKHLLGRNRHVVIGVLVLHIDHFFHSALNDGLGTLIARK